MPDAEKPKTILEAIVRWSDGRPLWQRDALRRIIRTGALTENDYEELAALSKKACGADNVAIDASPLSAKHVPTTPGDGDSISLVSIAEVEGVNQLAASQTLAFEPKGLTVIYGQNGTGKSGYSRILKKTCRARMPGEILPDIAQAEPVPPRASIAFKQGQTDGILNWSDNGAPDATLAAVTVFDRDSGAAHIQKKNEAWFTPFGLDVPNTLAAACDEIAKRLKAEKAECERARNAVFDAPTWSSGSALGLCLSNLTADTDVADVFDKVSFDEEDAKRLQRLTVDLAPENDPIKTADQNRRAAMRIDRLRTIIDENGSHVSDVAIETLVKKRNAARDARMAVKAAAEVAFGDLALSGVGDPVWRALWDAARRYAAAAGDPTPSFPTEEGQPCVLCHQPISPQAASRLAGFEAFIQEDTERAATAAEEVWDAALQDVKANAIATRDTQEPLRLLADLNASLARAARRRLASLRLRRRQILNWAKGNGELAAAEIAPLELDMISTAADSLRSYAKEIAASANADVRQKLITEKNDLHDRQSKDTLKPIAVAEVARLQTIKMLDAALSDCVSTTVTKFANSLADDFITDRMRDRFQKEIVALADNQVRVEVTRAGGKSGTPQFEVKLFADKKAKVHLVLSEGEQTCVALAAYLTELANSEHASALVFDDPVTSLDHRWRHKVATRLVEEAGNRQIIVFTHDLVFVNDLDELAQKARVPIELRHLVRAPTGAGVVKDGLPWKGAKLGPRYDALEKGLSAAKKLYDAGDEDGYENAAFDIYNRLRATWERAIEDVVFNQVLQRHREYINTGRLLEVAVLTEADAEFVRTNFEKCCDYVSAHDPSRGKATAPPTPANISKDIEALRTWATDLSKRQNQHRKAQTAAKTA